jgi:hypothetical protein
MSENPVSTWQIDRSGPSSESGASTPSDVPLKWAHDALTGEPRYIHDSEVIDHQCSCICPACRLVLTPVMAGQPLRVRPTAHFRHPAGSQKDACTLVAARLAATHLLLENGFIDLPRRTMSRTAIGFSGQGYEIWVEEPSERRVITNARLHDHATAELTLDDGRKLLVDLTGRREPIGEGNGQAVVTISLSDPELAMLSPDEIRSRLRILPDIHWCAHWNDQALAAKGDAEASRAAYNALDDWSAEDEADFRSRLTPDIDEETARNLRRETLLHREAKAILEREQRITTPCLEVRVTRDPPDEFIGEWETDTLRMNWFAAPKMLELTDVRLERRLGRIVPDIVANLAARDIHAAGIIDTCVNDGFEEEIEDTSSLPWPSILLVEVTVTHGIDEEKRRRIRELNLATLEIDLSLLGGRITREDLRDLIVDQTVGKRWVHHPVFPIKQQRLNTALDEHPVTLRYQERLIELRRPQWLAVPASHWAHCYLEAVTRFHDENVLIRRAQRKRQGDGPKPKLLGKESGAWPQIAEAAEALAAHGLPGAADAFMLDESGLIARLLSLQRNTGVGYDVGTGYQVLNAIMQSGKDSKRWDTLYAIAVKAYSLEAHFTSDQARKYDGWRQTLIAKVDAYDEAYMRPATFDALLSVLFPAMAERINKGYGRLPDQAQ